MNVLVCHLIRYIGWPGVLSNWDRRVHMPRAAIARLNLKLGHPGVILHLGDHHPRCSLAVALARAARLGIGTVTLDRLELNRGW